MQIQALLGERIRLFDRRLVLLAIRFGHVGKHIVDSLGAEGFLELLRMVLVDDIRTCAATILSETSQRQVT